jgi:phenylalanyl-tRNA synthetase beta chain
MMLVPLSWLRDFVDIELPAAEVAELLTNAGLEVKYINFVGLEGADLAWDREKIVLAKLLSVEQHPDAERLVLATVDYGAEEPKTVVTGAPNLFQYVVRGDISDEALYSPLALEGATLYDGHKEGNKKTQLKGRALRGIYNDSMLCSEKELGISDEHEGIILMRKDAWSPDYQVGTSLQDVLGDVVLEIDIIPNIARCASMVGVAREYAALTDQPLRKPDYNVVMEGPPADGLVELTTAEPDLNPRFVAALITGVTQVPSPYWMQYRLHLAGQRSINVVVDISNYVMLEMGQPNHTFDYDFLRRRADDYDANGPVHSHTRLPHEGETLTTLDDVEHKLPEYTILVTDPAGALSLGGIMGGLDSEIKPETTNVLLEAAAWDFINIRRSATQLGISSDAAFRFSRGVHPSQAILGARRAAELMRRLAGGTVWQGIFDYYPNPPEAVTVELSPQYVQRLSGLSLKEKEIAALLERLQFVVEPYGDNLMVTVPDYRMDIEGPHDVVEEVCRLVGYDKIPSTIIADELPPQHRNVELEQEEGIRDLLVQLGLQEVITYRLTAREREARLLPTATGVGQDDRPYVMLTNPISADRAVLRHSLLSSVLEIGARNSRYQDRIAIFEIGDVFLESEDSILPDELTHLAIVLTGPRYNAHWSSPNGSELLDFFDLKGVLQGLFEELQLAVKFEAATHPSFSPGQAARLRLGDSVLGTMGTLHPQVANAYGFRVQRQQPVLAADIDLELVLAQLRAARVFEPVSSYPAVREDLALIVDRHVPADEVAALLLQAGGFLLKEVELFDRYEGPQIPAGKKSLAYHLTFQSPSKTLTDKEVSKQRQRIVAQLEQRLGAQLRG